MTCATASEGSTSSRMPRGGRWTRPVSCAGGGNEAGARGRRKASREGESRMSVCRGSGRAAARTAARAAARAAARTRAWRARAHRLQDRHPRVVLGLAGRAQLELAVRGGDLRAAAAWARRTRQGRCVCASRGDACASWLRRASRERHESR
eukprot:7180900-Prymnesium_polylepis.1